MTWQGKRVLPKIGARLLSIPGVTASSFSSGRLPDSDRALRRIDGTNLRLSQSGSSLPERGVISVVKMLETGFKGTVAISQMPCQKRNL
jgi:hypothetical protein